MRTGIAAAIVLGTAITAAQSARAIEICSGGDRAARRVTCLVDGDTGWERGVKWRLLDIDAPETFEAECGQEKEIGKEATRRLLVLMSAGYRLVESGEKDHTSDRRSLVRIVLADGRDAGRILLQEGLAQRWPNKGNRWCGF
ncbi:thermonuclease family protein [Sinorhizobium sp. 6-117]|nr:thermonuclease family protein [Sinorhizobium sp. 6-117]